MAVLGIHDGLGASASTIEKGNIIGAVSEERFTRQKNDVGFPFNSIEYLNENFDEINQIAISWIGGSAFIRRFLPKYEEKRRLLWRKQIKKPSHSKMKLNNIVYNFIQNQKPKRLWHSLGKTASHSLEKRIKKTGLQFDKFYYVDHHMAHAASAYYTCGFDPCLIITLDGSGDGLSGTINIGRKGDIEKIEEFEASKSLGLFFGAVTSALDMRYSEDEGKTMSLAPYSYPIRIRELEKIINIKDGKPNSNFTIKNELLMAEWIKNNILWKYNRESLAYAAQHHLENCVMEIFRKYMGETGIQKIAVAGGVFANVILNMRLREMPEVKDFFVFPHMGDGGLSTGAALYVDHMINGKFNKKQIDNVYFGSSFKYQEIEQTLKKYKNKIEYEERSDISKFTGELINKGNIILWFQDRMEFGPRALGNRSILAPAGNIECKDKLNLIIKRRPYFQPFCPTLLEEDANKILENYDKPNRFMSVGYTSKKKVKDKIKAVVHIDNTTRPQVLGDENKKYKTLIQTVKKENGLGIVLNTSFNKHRYPIVCSPNDAVWALLNTGVKHLSIGDFYVRKKD